MALRRTPLDERLPDGRTVQEAFAQLMAQQQGQQPVTDSGTMGGGAAVPTLGPPTQQPAAVPVAPALPAPSMQSIRAGAPSAPSVSPFDPTAPTPGPATPDPYRGPVGEERTAGLSPLGAKMAEYRARSTAKQYDTGIYRSATGVGAAPPQTNAEVNAPRSRLKQALIGALQGAAMGAQNTRGGDAWGALGGAATGAAAGGISPRLMQAFTRDQQAQILKGEIASDQALELRTAQIAGTEAQTEARRAEPYLRAAEIRRRGERDDAASKRAQQSEERRQQEFEERKRHNKVTEGQTTATEKITVGGREFNVSPAQAASIRQRQLEAGDKPDPTTESHIEADLEEEAAGRYDAAHTDANARLTELRNALGSLESVAHESDISPNRKAMIADMKGKVTELEKEVAYQRSQRDDARDRATKARAKAQSARGGSRTIDGAISEFTRTQKRKPTAQEIARMKAALGQ